MRGGLNPVIKMIEVNIAKYLLFIGGSLSGEWLSVGE
jgi:hypothetical protein